MILFAFSLYISANLMGQLSSLLFPLPAPMRVYLWEKSMNQKLAYNDSRIRSSVCNSRCYINSTQGNVDFNFCSIYGFYRNIEASHQHSGTTTKFLGPHVMKLTMILEAWYLRTGLLLCTETVWLTTVCDANRVH